MKISDMLALSTRMFKTRPMRTFLTVLGVGVGIGAVLFLVSLGYGLQNVILSRIANADSLLTLDVSPAPSDAITLTQQNIDTVAALPSVDTVARVKTFPGQITLESLTGNGQVTAVDASLFRLQGTRLLQGEFFSEQAKEAVLSSAAVRLFNLTPESAIGKRIALTLTQETGEDTLTLAMSGSYVVTGIVDDENASYAYIPLPFLTGIVSVDTYDQLKVKVKNNGVMAEARDDLLARGYIVSALSDTIDQANKVFRVVQIILALFGLVALLVSAIGMFNTMTITLLERTNEIGIMRSIGITRSDIRKIFLVESMLMGFLGGVGGIILGTVGGWLANAGINLLAAKLGGHSMDLFYVPPWFVMVILIFSSAIGFLTGIYPSYRASTLNPLDALRYK